MTETGCNGTRTGGPTPDRNGKSNLRDWATRERLHSGETLIQVLDERFERRLLTRGPYYFVHLADTDEADEQAAIDTGQIQANRIVWVGTLPGV